jgi:hypothetical protein
MRLTLRVLLCRVNVVPRNRKKGMSMKKDKPVAVAGSTAVLLPAENQKPCDGLAIIYENGWAKGRRVRVMRSYEKEERQKADPRWYNFIAGVKKLMASEERPDDRPLIQGARELISPQLGLSTKDQDDTFFKDAWFAVSGAVAFEGVRLTLWQTNADKKGRKHVLLGLYCPDRKSALAADMLLRSNFKICTHCNKEFLAQRPKQTACSVKCREAHRSARAYAKKKALRIAA